MEERKQPNWKAGVRCSEDASGNLWVGKAGHVPFHTVFPNLEEIIKKKMRELRGDRTGAFWINPEKRKLTVVSLDSVESKNHPQANY